MTSPSIKEALEACRGALEILLAAYGPDIRGVAIAAINKADAALATLQPDGTEQASNEQGNVGKGLPNGPENDPKNENTVAGEMREAIARLAKSALSFAASAREGASKVGALDSRGASDTYKEFASQFERWAEEVELLASGLVQDEAGEPTTAMIDAGVAFALSVSLSSEYRWSQYVADLYKTMRAAFIRSARDGGAET